MSHTEYHFGTIKLLKSDLTLEEQMLELLAKHGHTTQPSYCSTVAEWFHEELGHTFIYVVYNNKIYKVFDKELDPEADLERAEYINEEEISYQLKYYNGGTCFSECLEDALKKLPEYPKINII